MKIFTHEALPNSLQRSLCHQLSTVKSINRCISHCVSNHVHMSTCLSVTKCICLSVTNYISQSVRHQVHLSVTKCISKCINQSVSHQVYQLSTRHARVSVNTVWNEWSRKMWLVFGALLSLHLQFITFCHFFYCHIHISFSLVCFRFRSCYCEEWQAYLWYWCSLFQCSNQSG